MCGICGIANTTDKDAIVRNTLVRMSEKITHRGPDDFGFYVDSHVGLGSRRLSIIDLHTGKQPISDEDQNLWIVFNGEIYNYKQLRVHLEKLGHRFKTDTDTETILHLYQHYGKDCVHHLNGMFVFAIWNIAEQSLFIARDRMGIKPLYYSKIGNELIFGSELKALLEHPSLNRQVDLMSLNEYLSYEYVPTPKTILRDVYRLQPGHFILFQNDQLTIQPYWDISLDRSQLRPPVNWQEYREQLEELLYECVNMETVSDVPVGVFLSGGVDSSTIAAIMSQNKSSTVSSFSVSFDDPSFDESQYAQLVSEQIGTSHYDLKLDSQMALNLTASIADYMDEPFADSSFVPTFFLSKLASEHVKVVLGGDGGDELFVGYPTYVAHKMIEQYERFLPRYVRSTIVPKALDLMPLSLDNISLDFRLRRFLLGRSVPLQTRHHRWLGAFIDEQKELLIQQWVKPGVRGSYLPTYNLHEQYKTLNPMNQLLYTDFKTYLEGDILYKVDRASMAHSLEVRVPLLNYKLVEFVNTLPFELKLKRFTSKFILKKTVANILPDSIINRPKKGFNMPVAKWLKNEFRELLLDTLSSTTLGQHDFFDGTYVTQLINDHMEGHKDNRKELWTLLMFQLWYNKHNKT